MTTAKDKHPIRMTFASATDKIDEIAIGQDLAALVCSSSGLVSVWRLNDEVLVAEVASLQNQTGSEVTRLRHVRVSGHTLLTLDSRGELKVWQLPDEPYHRLSTPQHCLTLNQQTSDQLTGSRGDCDWHVSRKEDELFVSQVSPGHHLPEVTELMCDLPRSGQLLDACVSRDHQLLVLCCGIGLLRIDTNGTVHQLLTLGVHDPKIEPRMSLSSEGHFTLVYKNKKENSLLLLYKFTPPDSFVRVKKSSFTFGRRGVSHAVEGRLIIKSGDETGFNFWCEGREDTPAQFGGAADQGENWRTQLSSDAQYTLTASKYKKIHVTTMKRDDNKSIDVPPLCFFRELQGTIVTATKDRRCKVVYLRDAKE